MEIFYKKCEVCGEKISKLQSWTNIYFLKTGESLKCQNCCTEYKVNKIISFTGYFYTWGGVWILVVLLIISYIDSFKFNLGVEVWLYSFIIYSVFELIVMLLLPLKK